jgi:hypothetical protein
MSRLSIAAFLLFAALPSPGAELKQPTLDAWDQYLSAANASMADRARGHFLWTDESPERVRSVRSGEVIVAPMGHTPQSVRDGLIHHWIGVAFISGVRIDDVIAVVRNYDRYTEFYKPSVIGAKALSQKAAEDRFTVLMFDKALFMKRALDSDYQSRFVEVDRRRSYSVSQTTRVQEVSDQGRIPDGEGSGYIWRLCTMSRYEERDGGVYVETEAMALSRPIPGALHFVVDPIVRRVSKASLTKSLEQTRDATGSLVKSEAALSASRRQPGRASSFAPAASRPGNYGPRATN